MTVVIITNIVLAAAVFTVIVGMIAWTIRSSVPRQQRLAHLRAAPTYAAQTAARQRARGSLARQTQ